MGLSDRDYMRPESRAARRGRRPSVLDRLKFMLWRWVRRLREGR